MRRLCCENWLYIVNVSLPEAVEKAMDTRSSMGVIGDMQKFQEYQMGNALMEAASNPAGGGATEGMGLGLGFAMANQMIKGPGVAGAAGAAAPPAPPTLPAWHVAINGQTQGPFNPQQLTQSVASGQLAPSTLVWCAGMSGWTAAGEVPQLSGLFASQTPPPPPPPVG